MKKFISMFLAVVMVAAIAVTAIPTSFAAVDEAHAFRVGDNSYATLKEAINNVPDGGTIEMLKDYTDTTADNLGTFGKSFTINGNGFTYSKANNTNKYFFVINSNAVVTLNNFNFNGGSGIIVRTATLNMNNCNFQMTYRMAVSTNSGSTQVINLHNTHLEMVENAALGQPVILLDSENNTLNATGTTKIVRNNGIGDQGEGNRSAINIGGQCTGTTIINMGKETELVINHKNDTSYVKDDTTVDSTNNNAVGIYHGKGVLYANFEEGATVRVDTARKFTNIVSGSGDLNRYLTTAGMNVLKKSTSPTTINGYTSGINMAKEIFKYVQNDTVVEEGYVSYDFVPNTSYAANTVMYIDESGNKQTTTSLWTAISAARKAGTRIYLLADYTETANAHTIATDAVIDGNGFNMTFNGKYNYDGGFPITVEGTGKTVEVRNFASIDSCIGLFECKEGTLNISYVNFARSFGRATLKLTADANELSNVNIEKSFLTVGNAVKEQTTPFGSSTKWGTAKDNNSGETTLIMYQPGTNTLTLKDGAVLSKDNISAGTAGSGSVGYTYGVGTNVINMESGSKIIANQVSGANGGIIGIQGTNNTTMNIENGAYLVLDSTALTTNFYFADASSQFNGNNKTVNFVLNAYDGAFLVKNEAKTTVKTIETKGDNIYKFEALATSPVSGYTAYKLAVPTFINNDIYAGGYDTLGDAVAAASAGHTIEMTDNYSGNETGIAFNKNLTWNLKGFTYETTNAWSGGNNYLGTNTANLTITNGNLKLCAGINTTEGGLTLDGLNIVWGTNNNNYTRPIAKLGNTTTALTINDCIIAGGLAAENDKNSEAMILVEHGATGTVNFTGDTKVSYTGKLKVSSQNATIVAVQTGTAAENTDTSAIVNVGANVTLTGKHVSYTTPDASTASLFYCSTSRGGTLTVNLEKGATLEMLRTNIANNSKTYFAYNAATINDNGANFVVSKDALATGIILPTLTMENATFIGFGVNGKVYAGGVTATEVVEDATVALKTAYFSTETFDLIDGASIRTVENENGIRFSTYMSNDLLTALGGKDNVTMGTYITPGDTTTTPSTDAAAIKIVSSENFNTAYEGYEGMNVYNTAVIMEGVKYEGTDDLVPDKEIYNLQLVAQSYFTVTYADGSTETFYTTVGEENVRSMAYVAEKLLPKYENATDAAGIKIYEFMQAIVNAAK